MQTSYQNFGETNLAAHYTFKIFHLPTQTNFFKKLSEGKTSGVNTISLWKRCLLSTTVMFKILIDRDEGLRNLLLNFDENRRFPTA